MGARSRSGPDAWYSRQEVFRQTPRCARDTLVQDGSSPRYAAPASTPATGFVWPLILAPCRQATGPAVTQSAGTATRPNSAILQSAITSRSTLTHGAL